MMTKDQFYSIIDFAIEREKEAVLFYRELQTLKQLQAQLSTLKDLELMEENHVLILEKIRNQDYSTIKVPEVQDLKISNYIVAEAPGENMTYADIVVMAMKKEEAASNLYLDLANTAAEDESDMKNAFLRLAAEEAKHKLYFEKIYDEEILKEN
jgi:rubrerythrin